MRVIIDRIESGIAVLITQGTPPQRILFPAHELPAGSRENDVLTLTLDKDEDEMRERTERISALQDRLAKKP